MRKLLYIFAAIIGLGLGACDIIDRTTGDQTEIPETPQEPEDPGQGDGTDDPEGSDDPEEQKKKEFVILFTNDFHSQIEPLSKEETYNADRGGIKRIKVLVDSVRNAEPAVLLADAGDMVQGTYYFSLLNGVVEMMIMDELGYDVRTLGNHEFDKKMVGLGDMLALSKVPVVATNYNFSKTNLADYVLPSTIIEARNVKVGFIGLNVRLQNLVDPTACEGVE
jgi:5'-nucleotidase